MDSLALLAGQLEPSLGTFVLSLGRLSPIIFLMPGIGEQFLSVRVKLFVLLALAASLTMTGVVAPIRVAPLDQFVPAFLIEVFTGLKMGLLLRATIWVLLIVGNVIANMIGLSQLIGVATNSESQTVLGNMLGLAGTALLVTLDFHVLVFSEVVRSYVDQAPGYDAGLSAQTITSALSQSVNFAIVLAWPFVAASLIYNLCLGFINRAMPQLMVAFVGAPFMIGAGFLLFLVSISGILLVWHDRAFGLIGFPWR